MKRVFDCLNSDLKDDLPVKKKLKTICLLKNNECNVGDTRNGKINNNSNDSNHEIEFKNDNKNEVINNSNNNDNNKISNVYGISVILINTFEECIFYINKLLSYKPIILGLDCEWKPYFNKNNINKISLLQISDNNICLLIRLKNIFENNNNLFPNQLINLLINPKLCIIRIINTLSNYFFSFVCYLLVIR